MNIDHIAREMVDIEPSADLEARIRARLAAAPPGRRAPWWTWRVVVPLTAAAAFALALIVVHSPESRVQSPGPVAGAKGSKGGWGANSPVPQFSSSPVAQVRTSQHSKISTSRLPDVRTSQLSSEEIAWMKRRMPALDTVDALQMERLVVESIQPEPLGITPLTMTPVATESGGIERRNDR